MIKQNFNILKHKIIHVSKAKSFSKSAKLEDSWLWIILIFLVNKRLCINKNDRNNKEKQIKLRNYNKRK